MSDAEAGWYERYQGAVKREIAQLRIILERYLYVMARNAPSIYVRIIGCHH